MRVLYFDLLEVLYVGLNRLELISNNLQLSLLVFVQILKFIRELVNLHLKHLQSLGLDVDRFDRVSNRIFYVKLAVAKTTDFATDSFSYRLLTC